MSNHDIEGNVPPEAEPGAVHAPAGAPESLEGQLAREREARQLIRDRLRHTEALAAESHALRAKMAEELERVTADRDRLRTEARIAAAIATDEPPAAQAAAPSAASAAAEVAHPVPAGTPRPPPAAGGPRVAPGPRSARGAEPTMSPTPPPARPPSDHLLGERPLKPPVRRGPWRALAMLGGLAAAVAGLAWLTGTMPSGFDMASLPAAASAPGLGSTPAASAPAQASAARPGVATATAVAAAAPASMPGTTPRGAVPLPAMTPEARLAAAPAAAGPATPAAPATGVAPAPEPVPAPPPDALRGQSRLQAAGGLDVRLRKALDGEGITSRVEIDPANGHVLVADPQADRALRDRTDMLIRAVYAGASLSEPQIEHRWLSPMQGERPDVAQAQGPAPTNPRPPTPAQAQPRQSQRGSPAVGLATKHVDAPRVRSAVADVEELRPVVPAGRLTEGCMADIAGKASNRRAALTACMKRSCCSSSTNHNSEECRAYQKAYPYTCGAG